jgi:TRAP transporter TAXI family solute receptor
MGVGNTFISTLRNTAGIAMLMAALVACDRAPTDETLAADLNGYVESNYAPGVVEVGKATRLDHLYLPDFRRDQRAVAYSADLRLKRDYDFGLWDQAGAATLTNLLGATPQAVSGLKTGGNKTGDVVRVEGTLLYKRHADHWRLEAGAPPQRPTADFFSWGFRRDILNNWWNVTTVAARVMLTSDDAADAERLFTSIKAASIGIARQRADNKAVLAVASGPSGGDYWLAAHAVAENGATAQGKRLINVETKGARENLRLLRDGDVTAAVLRSSDAALAAGGEGPFDQDGTFPTLRALGSLFPEQVHVVVMATSPVASVSDLIKRRVAIGGGEPPTSIEAGDVLRAHRVPFASLSASPQILPAAAALALLEQGACDAVIITAPAPSTALRDFAIGHAVRFLPLDADAVALLTTGRSSNYVAATIPALTYPGQTRPVMTVAVTALLVSTDTIPPADTTALLQKAYGAVDFMAHGSALGAMIKLPMARRGLTLPLHLGAEAFYAAKESPK